LLIVIFDVAKLSIDIYLTKESCNYLILKVKILISRNAVCAN